MSKTMKKVLALIVAVAVAITVAYVPAVKTETTATKVASAAVNASGQTIVPYNAYIGFQLGGYWVARDEWTSATRGLDATKVDGTGAAYNYKKQFISNDGNKSNNFKTGSNIPVDGGFIEPEIVDNGEQVIQMTKFNINDYKDTDEGCWNSLFISTSIPLTMKGVTCTNVKLYLDDATTPWVTIKNASYNQESTTNGGCYQFYIFDTSRDNHKTTYAKATKTAAGAILKTYQKFPTKNLKIEYTLSGVNFSAAAYNPVARFTGANEGEKFNLGDFKYKVATRSKDNGTKGKVSIVGLSAAGKKKSSLTIPTSIKKAADASYTVTGIASKAFAKANKLKKITMSSTMKSVPAKAFQNCTKLTTVKFGKKVTKIGASAFDGCKSLKTINIGKVKSIGKSAFNKCTKLKKITIGTKVKVSKKAFNGCKKTIKISGKKAHVKYTKEQVKKSGYKKVK